MYMYMYGCIHRKFSILCIVLHNKFWNAWSPWYPNCKYVRVGVHFDIALGIRRKVVRIVISVGGVNLRIRSGWKAVNAIYVRVGWKNMHAISYSYKNMAMLSYHSELASTEPLQWDIGLQLHPSHWRSPWRHYISYSRQCIGESHHSVRTLKNT